MSKKFAGFLNDLDRTIVVSQSDQGEGFSDSYPPGRHALPYQNIPDNSDPKRYWSTNRIRITIPDGPTINFWDDDSDGYKIKWSTGEQAPAPDDVHLMRGGEQGGNHTKVTIRVSQEPEGYLVTATAVIEDGHRTWVSKDDDNDMPNSWTKDFKNDEKVTKIVFIFKTPAQSGAGTDANISISWGTKPLRQFSANQPGVMEQGSDHWEWVPIATTIGELRSGVPFIIRTDNSGAYPEWHGSIMTLIKVEGRNNDKWVADGMYNFKTWGGDHNAIVLNREFPEVNLY